MADRLAIHTSSVIRRGAGLHSGREAIVFGEQRLTYGDLAEETDRLAAQLGAAGLRPGDKVALLGRNCVEYAVALLALHRRGFVGLPLNWRLSDHALAGTAAKFAPRAILHTEEFAGAAARLAAAREEIVLAHSLDGGRAQLPSAEQAARWVEENAAPPRREDLFACISTGGTEGLPKGVPVTNAMVEACVIGLFSYESLREDDVTMILPQMFHNPQLYVIAPLLVGGKLVIPTMPSFDSELVLRTIESERVTRFLGVATMMTYMMDAQDRIGADIASLRSISYGGSPFSPKTVERLVRTFQCDLLQLYGQTETSVVVSVLGAEDHRGALADPELRHRLGSAGRPIGTVEIRVVDDADEEVPRDRVTVGEVAVLAPTTMDGYVDQPELSAEKLRGGWCHTGDLATWDEDGFIYIVDRRNDMIISGGENVFPSAVEEVVREVPAVEEVVVIGVPDDVWGEVVTAVVLPREGEEAPAEAINELCRERLASYMRPRAIEVVDELPKNPSGKILRGEVKQRFAGRVGRI
ncbi:MAG: AMP-binding protein [Solirubrobacterales bacterium]